MKTNETAYHVRHALILFSRLNWTFPNKSNPKSQKFQKAFQLQNELKSDPNINLIPMIVSGKGSGEIIRKLSDIWNFRSFYTGKMA